MVKLTFFIIFCGVSLYLYNNNLLSNIKQKFSQIRRQRGRVDKAPGS